MTDQSTRKPIKKAVFPVAGLGTRFLPATKAIPKEMLPIIDRPLIQYAVDEAREAGIEQLIFVTGRGKLRSVSGSSVSSAHGSSVSAEFFAPEMGMVPERRFPPWMMILSIESRFSGNWRGGNRRLHVAVESG